MEIENKAIGGKSRPVLRKMDSCPETNCGVSQNFCHILEQFIVHSIHSHLGGQQRKKKKTTKSKYQIVNHGTVSV